MAKLTEGGRDRVTATQKALARAKDALRDIAREMRKLAEEDRAAGDLGAANACNDLEGAAHEALGLLIRAHAKASDALIQYHAEDAGEIVVMGGGGGR